MKQNPALYEIKTYAWLYELSRKSGKRVTLGNIPSFEWDRFEELGFDYIWLMGIWKRSKTGIKIFKGETAEYVPFISYMDSILPDRKDEDLVGSP